MTISELIYSCKPVEVFGDANVAINGIEIDSRNCKEGYAFVALPGTQTDGHQYIDKAIALGAVCVICEKLPSELQQGVTYLVYESTTDVVGPLATSFYGNPTRKMKLVGVTGTNGKTTIATTLYNVIRRMGIKAGLCSTVCNYIDGEPVPTECTTPDPITLNRLLAQM
ncbi:MAG: UDP-N-acetylmuramoyl-L-alanyl-D-glutamate--2,6-diaminopimelate ligase, partial [Bacteroidaceae bacterium]|nr:UDP-N-acetylmuramoyl-L-alanyl-D-glutamate--2,6-diaminopimelate ligase [Bacteroidaceae bacterium]